ncbi:MAG: TonB-dependent receptor [Gammaproteobacteria bacterium]
MSTASICTRSTDTFRYSINDQLTLKNIVSYSRFQYLANQDADASPLAILDTITPDNQWNTDTDNYSEELQLQGRSFQDHLQWVVGGYGEYDKPAGIQTQWTAQFQGSPSVAPTAAVQSQEYRETRRSYALYAQGTYDLGALTPALERLKLTAGYRYTWDRKNNTTDAALPLQGFACTTFPGLFRPNCTLSAIQQSSAPTWIVGLDYKLTPDALIYAKYSRGYKTGGSNPTSIDPSALTFRPEYVEDVEVGLKSDWNWDGVRAQFNLDVFPRRLFGHPAHRRRVFCRQDRLGGRSTPRRRRFAEPRPRRRCSRSSRSSWPRHTLTSMRSTTASCSGATDLSSQPFAFTPRNKYSFTTRYSLHLSDQLGTLKTSLTYSHTDQWYIGVTSIEPTAWVPGYNLIDLRAGLEGVAGRPLDLTLFASNLANKEFRIGSTALLQHPGLLPGGVWRAAHVWRADQLSLRRSLRKQHDDKPETQTSDAVTRRGRLRAGGRYTRAICR